MFLNIHFIHLEWKLSYIVSIIVLILFRLPGPVIDTVHGEDRKEEPWFGQSLHEQSTALSLCLGKIQSTILRQDAPPQKLTFGEIAYYLAYSLIWLMIILLQFLK